MTQHSAKNGTKKTETAVNFAKLKPNRKLQFFCKTEPNTEQESFFANHIRHTLNIIQ